MRGRKGERRRELSKHLSHRKRHLRKEEVVLFRTTIFHVSFRFRDNKKKEARIIITIHNNSFETMVMEESEWDQYEIWAKEIQEGRKEMSRIRSRFLIPILFGKFMLRVNLLLLLSLSPLVLLFSSLSLSSDGESILFILDSQPKVVALIKFAFSLLSILVVLSSMPHLSLLSLDRGGNFIASERKGWRGEEWRDGWGFHVRREWNMWATKSGLPLSLSLRGGASRFISRRRKYTTTFTSTL